MFLFIHLLTYTMIIYWVYHEWDALHNKRREGWVSQEFKEKSNEQLCKIPFNYGVDSGLDDYHPKIHVLNVWSLE